MKKKRNWKGIVIAAVLILTIIGGGGYGIRRMLQKRGGSVEVIPVSRLNNANWIVDMDYDGDSTGVITSDVNQEVSVSDDQVIEDVYVSQGDKVKIGDKLVKYDTTLLELDQELQELTVQSIGLELKSAEADLEKLKNTTPVARSQRSAAEDDELEIQSGLPEQTRDWELDDDDDDLDVAMAARDDHILLAAPEPEASTQENTEAQTAGSEAAAQENPADTELEESLTESEITQEQAGGSDTEAVEEFILDNEDQTEKDADTKNREQELSGGRDEEKQKPKLNERLTHFLQNIRIKKVDPDGEKALLADTQGDKKEPVKAAVDGDIEVIPHFKEDAEHHFEKLNTYMLLIRGIELEEDISGKIYGTAVIDGSDYPEIGGFTLTQNNETRAKHVVTLTLAFHDGLDKQHEIRSELEDMYLEIPVKLSQLAMDNLTFRTSEKEAEDVEILLEKSGVATEDTVPEPVADASQDPQKTGSDDTSGKQEPSDSQENKTGQSEEERLTEEETEVQSETTSETLENPVSEIGITVKWNHGTNDRLRWPTEMMLYLHETGNSETAPVGIRVTAQKAFMAEHENRAEMEKESETSTEAESGTESRSDTEASASADSGIAREQEPETEAEAAVPDGEILDPQDTYPSTETWTLDHIKWTAQLAPAQYIPTTIVQNYVPTFAWNGTILEISMNYLEPVESPLTRLDPLSELTFWSGYDKKYYKGSGTEEDPYVFFVTDGATIRNTFVNWALGFNEDGTIRLSDQGYHVVLEIRESDTITGAFIKKVALDGTIRMDHGYGPGTYWVFRSDTGIVKYEEEIPDPEGDDDDDNGGGDIGWDDGESYTAEELAEAIKEKEREIRELKVQEKEANLKLKKYNKKMDDSTVVSAVNGYVKSIGSGDDSDAYMVVSSEEGLYLKGTVSELDLDSVQKGETIKCTSYDTGMEFEATITNIDFFPSGTGGEDMWGNSGNTNSSSYPIIAHVEDQDSLVDQEWVSIKLPTKKTDKKGIYLANAYIRAENGQSYVYVQGEDGVLHKQYVRTGSTTYGYVEIREGLSESDYIAFPYGKNVKEGASVKVASEDSDYGF
ncbi:MAG: hypothetical protein Q4B57_07895 [Eubacteriales bacterium]|nr:hypothetical protein [Eubacteriales bacterium]